MIMSVQHYPPPHASTTGLMGREGSWFMPLMPGSTTWCRFPHMACAIPIPCRPAICKPFVFDLHLFQFCTSDDVLLPCVILSYISIIFFTSTPCLRQSFAETISNTTYTVNNEMLLLAAYLICSVTCCRSVRR